LKWDAIVHSIEEEKGVFCVEFEKKFIKIPLECLPEGCRVGDVLEVSISFNPFKTLEHIKNSKKEK